MSTRTLRAIAWVLALACLVPWFGNGPRASASLAVRLVGPIAGLAASVEWVRFDIALAEGRYERAYAHAERALRLEPRAPQGWITFGSHLGYLRASALNEPDPATRRKWIRAGLEVLERGEEQSRDPGECAFARGILLSYVATVDGPQELGWPGGRRGAADEAAKAFRRAGQRGHLRGFLMEGVVRDADFGLPDDGSNQ